MLNPGVQNELHVGVQFVYSLSLILEGEFTNTYGDLIHFKSPYV